MYDYWEYIFNYMYHCKCKCRWLEYLISYFSFFLFQLSLPCYSTSFSYLSFCLPLLISLSATCSILPPFPPVSPHNLPSWTSLLIHPFISCLFCPASPHPSPPVNPVFLSSLTPFSYFLFSSYLPSPFPPLFSFHLLPHPLHPPTSPTISFPHIHFLQHSAYTHSSQTSASIHNRLSFHQLLTPYSIPHH